MADRACNYCDDRGDCARCSYFFEPEKVHSRCGRKWKEHEIRDQPTGSLSASIYPPWAECPRAAF